MAGRELNIKLNMIRQSILKGKAALESEEIEKLSNEFSGLIEDASNHKVLLSEKENLELLLAILKAIPTSQLVDKLLKDLDTEKLYEFCELLTNGSDKNQTIIDEISHELLNLIRNTHLLQKRGQNQQL